MPKNKNNQLQLCERSCSLHLKTILFCF
jgi:hypothetical protein